MIGRLLLVTAALAVCITARPDLLFANDDDDNYMHPHLENIARAGEFRINSEEYEMEYWNQQARETIATKNKELNKNVAKNVIMFLGDGMGVTTLKAARVYMGQLNGEDGEGIQLAMEKLPYSGLSKTYCLDYQVADSACTATAYLCGVKAMYGTIGVGGNVRRGDCAANLIESNKASSIARWSQVAGKRTGIVSTARITHASPAGAFAQVADREWESDYDTSDSSCPDIAYQLIHGETGKNFNVILGGGRRNFIPNSIYDEENTKGRRRDGLNLIDEWLESKENENAAYVWNRTGLLEAAEDSDYLLGLFDSTHMQYYLDADPELEPTLEEMTEAAIKVLSKSENGYFLFVEGGKIDHGHHDGLTRKALAETVEFSKAIDKARELTSEEDTLIVVTADHSHVFTVSGYAKRGTDVLSVAGKADDGIAYSILSYANGPGYRKDVDGDRDDFSTYDTSDKELLYPAMVPIDSETHGGEEVGVFASGPWAHLISGVIEQSVIPHVMAFASCVGTGATACD
nr:alkaline phosphatase [Holotrichia parallela]